MAAKRKYYLDDTDEGSVTLSELKRLGGKKQLEYMRAWFGRFYEDPVHDMPYESSEGGYQYVYGGPYNALEELEAEFGQAIRFERIEEAAREIESEDGIFDWAPSCAHPDRERLPEDQEAPGEDPPYNLDAILVAIERGVRPRYGDRRELALRREIVHRLEAIERELVNRRPKHGGIGHNRPPPDGGHELSETATAGIAEVTAIVRSELENPKPNALKVAHAALKLRGVLGWVGKKADKSADAFASTFGTATAALLTASMLGKIQDLVAFIAGWLQSVTSPF